MFYNNNIDYTREPLYYTIYEVHTLPDNAVAKIHNNRNCYARWRIHKKYKFYYDVYCSKSKNFENTMATSRFIIILQKNHVLLLQQFRTVKSSQWTHWKERFVKYNWALNETSQTICWLYSYYEIHIKHSRLYTF